ncbi:hypothetical protein NDI56_03895 [Haloarcula sp. S1CR25-12]|uniref:Small CPxCG-related zinc finger protein n=1 Tax=Haloarcula saliterrae TaxID=2950534 RepID=A0ABU2F8E9_9EURY|nr:hypothetical protein [Haloarcula sp. S1CR25-12]MDS0258553.1 hypothetical protein [Haloarcula sp. S1CR25-12]
MSDVTSEYGLIVLKCRSCKASTLFRLEIRHEADSTEYVANLHCAACEEEDKFRKAFVRSVEPAVVEKQRIDPGCHEANPQEVTDAE